jgi:hypothetical protein
LCGRRPSSLQVRDVGRCRADTALKALAGEEAGRSQQERLGGDGPPGWRRGGQRSPQATIGQEAGEDGERLLVLAVAEGREQAAVEDLVRLLRRQGKGEPLLLLVEPPLAQPLDDRHRLVPAQALGGSAAGLLPEGWAGQPAAELVAATRHPGGERHHWRPPAAGQARVLALVVLEHEVKDDIVVAMVAVMAVVAERAGSQVELDVAPARLTGGGDDGVAEVGAWTSAAPSPVDHPQALAVARRQGLRRKAQPLPQAC